MNSQEDIVATLFRAIGRGGVGGSDDPPVLGQILYISYIKC